MRLKKAERGRKRLKRSWKRLYEAERGWKRLKEAEDYQKLRIDKIEAALSKNVPMYEGLPSQSTVIRTRKKTRFMFCSFSLLLCSGSAEVSSYPFDKSSNLFFREFVTKTSQETDLFAIVTKKNVKWEKINDLFVFLIIHSSFFSH